MSLVETVNREPRRANSNFARSQSLKMDGCCCKKDDGIPRRDPVDTAALKKSKGLIILVIGGSGVGKLATKYRLQLISPSDILRSEVDSESERGHRFEEIMRRGCHVPADVIVQLVEEKRWRSQTLLVTWSLASPGTAGDFVAVSCRFRDVCARTIARRGYRYPSILYPSVSIHNRNIHRRKRKEIFL